MILDRIFFGRASKLIQGDEGIPIEEQISIMRTDILESSIHQIPENGKVESITCQTVVFALEIMFIHYNCEYTRIRLGEAFEN